MKELLIQHMTAAENFNAQDTTYTNQTNNEF